MSFWKTDPKKIGRNEDHPKERLEYLDLMYGLPNDFYTRGERSRYTVERFRLLGLIKEEEIR